MAARTPWHQWLDLRGKEVPVVARLVVLAGLTGMGCVCTTTLASTLLLARTGVAALPWVYLIQAIALSAVALVLGRAEARWGQQLPARWLQRGLAIGLIAWWAATWLAWPPLWIGLAVWAEIVFIYQGLGLWSAVSQALDLRQAKRLYGLIGAGLMVGELGGGLAIGPLTGLVAPQHLLPLGAVALLWAQRYAAQLPVQPVGEAMDSRRLVQPGARFLLRSRYVRRIVLLVFCAGLAWFIIDLTFLQAAEVRYDERHLAYFLGLFSGGVAVANLIVQFAVTSRLLQAGGVAAGLLALPLALLVPVALLWVAGVHWMFAVVVATKLLDEALRGTIHDASTQLLYQALPDFQRQSVHRLVAGVVEPAVGGMAGAALLLLGGGQKLGVGHTVLALALLLVPWIVCGVLLRANYRQALLSALGSRTVQPGQLDLTDPAMLALVRAGLDSPDDLQVQASLYLLDHHGFESGPATLRQLLARPGTDVRTATLDIIGRRQVLELAPPVAVLLHDPVLAVRIAAVRAFCRLGMGDVLAKISPLWRDAELDVQVAAAVGVVEALGVDGVVALAPYLQQLAVSLRPPERAALARILGETAIEKFYRPLLPLLADREPSVRRAAIAAAARVRNPALVPLLCQALADQQTHAMAVMALVKWGPDAAPPLLRCLQSPRTDLEVRGILRVCGRLRHPAALPVLRAHVLLTNETIRAEALAQLEDWGSHAAPDAPTVSRLLDDEIEDVRRTLHWMTALHDQPELLPLARALDFELTCNQQRILLVLGVRYDRAVVQQALYWHRRDDKAQRARALEVLETALTRVDAQRVMPALDFDHAPTSRLDALKRMGAHTTRAPHLPPAMGQVLRALLDPDTPLVRPWTRLLALHTVGAIGIENLRQEAAGYLHDPSEIFRQTAAYAAHGHRTMLLTVEKVLFLKGTDLFAGIAEEELVAVAEIARVQGFTAGQPVFAQGDIGDTLFVIVQGQVRIHIGEKTLVTLGQRAHFGELAVIDPQPRSASATAQQDCLLLEIGRLPFKELLERAPEVAHGVLVYLVHKVRTLTPK